MKNSQKTSSDTVDEAVCRTNGHEISLAIGKGTSINDWFCKRCGMTLAEIRGTVWK